MRRAVTLLLALMFCAISACGGGETQREYPTYRDENGFVRFLAGIRTEAEPWTEEERREYLSYLQPEEFDHPFTVEARWRQKPLDGFCGRGCPR